MKYIKWPDASENEPFKLGVVGDSEVTPFLEKLASSKKAGNRPIVLYKTTLSETEIISTLDMIFIPKGNAQNITELNVIAVKENIVIITEESEFPSGGHINFIEENGKLFFELDREELETAGLRVATELLALARPVQRGL